MSRYRSSGSSNGPTAAGITCATLPDGTIDRIEGFATEGDAAPWIRNESVVWLNSRRQLAAN